MIIIFFHLFKSQQKPTNSILFYVYGCFACMHVCVPCAFSAHRSGKRASDTLGMKSEDCELSCGYWELNLGPLKNQPVLLVTSHLSSPACPLLTSQCIVNFFSVYSKCIIESLVSFRIIIIQFLDIYRSQYNNVYMHALQSK